MADGVAHAVVPEHDVAGLAVAVHGWRAVHLFLVGQVLGRSIEDVAPGEILVENPVAARPNGESAAAGIHVVDVPHDAEVKGMGVHVATYGTGRRVAFGQDAVNTADPVRFDQPALTEQLLRHAHHGRIGGEEADHPVLSARFTVLPHVLMTMGRTVVYRLRERADPGFRPPAFEGRRQVAPHAIPAPGHKTGIEDAALDQIAFADEKPDVVGGQTDHDHPSCRFGWIRAENI